MFTGRGYPPVVYFYRDILIQFLNFITSMGEKIYFKIVLEMH
jgi:hypothetical protein